MRNGCYEYMDGFMLGRYPDKPYTWDVVKTTKKKPKDADSESKYTLFIVTQGEKGTIIAKSDELPSSVVSDLVSMSSEDLRKLCKTLKEVDEVG